MGRGESERACLWGKGEGSQWLYRSTSEGLRSRFQREAERYRERVKETYVFRGKGEVAYTGARVRD